MDFCPLHPVTGCGLPHKETGTSRHFSFPNALEQVPEGHRCESLAAKHRDVGKGIPRDPGGRRKKRLEFFILIKNHIRLTAAVITGEMDLVLKINIVAQAT